MSELLPVTICICARLVSFCHLGLISDPLMISTIESRSTKKDKANSLVLVDTVVFYACTPFKAAIKYPFINKGLLVYKHII